MKQVLMLWICIGFTLYANVIPLTTWSEAETYFQKANIDAWVVFDVDLVLIQPKDPLFQAKNAKAHFDIMRGVLQTIPPEKKEVFWQIMINQADHILLDECIPQTIKNLQQKCIPTMALTNTLTGSMTDVPCIVCKKIRTLRQLGIDFSCNPPCSGALTFDQFPSFRGSYPIYMQGVLFINGKSTTKGPALVALMNILGKTPKTVFFIDDLIENLHNVEQALRCFDPSIEYTGLLFSGAQHYPSPPVSANDFQEAWENIAQQTLAVD